MWVLVGQQFWLDSPQNEWGRQLHCSSSASRALTHPGTCFAIAAAAAAAAAAVAAAAAAADICLLLLLLRCVCALQCLGLASEVVDMCFKATASRIGGVGFKQLAADSMALHEAAYKVGQGLWCVVGSCLVVLQLHDGHMTGT
jgi:glutamate synthase domain-containing protein 2